MPGLLISIEGIEGAGKSTMATKIEEWFKQQGKPLFCTREPGGTHTGESLRKILLDAYQPLCIQTELLLMMASRAQLMDEMVMPKLKQEETVLIDRHIDSTIAYQGYGRGIGLDLIHTLNRFACFQYKPDLTILLDVDVATGLSRARSAKAAESHRDRFESETVEFMERVRNGFLEIAKQEPKRVIKVNAQAETTIIWEAIQSILTERLACRTPSSQPPMPLT